MKVPPVASISLGPCLRCAERPYHGASCGRALLGGVDSRWLQVKDGDAVDLQVAYRDAGRLVLERPSQDTGPVLPPAPSFQPTAELEGHQIQDLADLVPDLMEASAGYQLKFRIQMVLEDAPEEVRAGVEQLIDSRLKAEPRGPS